MELGYARMLRLDYDRQDVERYRQEVIKYVVPLAEKLVQAQKERLNLDHLAYYDLGLMFPKGNANPSGTSQEIVDKAQTMYHELSKETGEYFDFMRVRIQAGIVRTCLIIKPPSSLLTLMAPLTMWKS